MLVNSGQVKAQAIVVNSSHPELDQLAAELALRGRLKQYFGRYFPAGRAWERALVRLPLTRSLYQSGPGRRRMPAELRLTERHEGGALWDFGSALPRRLLGPRGEPGYLQMQQLRDDAIVREAMRKGAPECAVLANFSVAERVFERAARHGAARVLNYPIAHHTYARKLLTEEAERHPEFAADLRDQVPDARLAETLDRECELATTIILGSSFARESFVESGVPAEKLVVAPYGVEIADFLTDEPAEPDDVFRAVWVGQVSQRKGIKYLMEGWRKVYGAKMELLMAGHFKTSEAVFEPYAGLYQPLGFLDAAGLHQLLHRASVLVLPTLIEGMPLVVLQAMASGVPVIVTTHGPGDVVRDGIDGFHVPIRDADAIAEKLQLLRDSPELRVEMGRSARARASEFTWERFRRQTGDYVEGLLDSA